MNKLIEAAFAELDRRGIIYEPDSLARYGTQGIMSEVYILTTAVGELVLHVKEITPLLREFGMPHKLQMVSDAAHTLPDGLIAHVLFCIDRDEHAVIAQHKLPGHAAGSVALTDDKIVIEWDEPVELIGPQVETALAHVHAQVPAKGFGVPSSFDGTQLLAPYATWKEFLSTEAPRWAESVVQKSLGVDSSNSLQGLFDRFFDRALPMLTYDGPPSLVSTDFINPSNVLVDEGRVTGLIDWEWALLADPAWDFTYMNPYKMDHYFAVRGFDTTAQNDFRKRMKLCEPFAHLMWAYGVSHDPHASIFKACKARLEPALEHFLKTTEE